MSASNSFEQAILELFFQGVDYANIADDAAVSPLTSLYVALYTASPGDNGTAITNEATYTNYARVALVRSSVGWQVVDGTASNLLDITFPACGATGNQITHFGIVKTASGAGELYFSGEASLNVVQDVIPRFAAGRAKIQVS